jgi:hypothetical protein
MNLFGIASMLMAESQHGPDSYAPIRAHRATGLAGDTWRVTD